MRPGVQAFPVGSEGPSRAASLKAVSWQLWGFSCQTEPKQNILFGRFSAAYTKQGSDVHNINYIKLNNCVPAIAVFHPSTEPRIIQANTGFVQCVQVGRLLTQAQPVGL
jgi:hypothetical protein